MFDACHQRIVEQGETPKQNSKTQKYAQIVLKKQQIQKSERDREQDPNKKKINVCIKSTVKNRSFRLNDSNY